MPPRSRAILLGLALLTVGWLLSRPRLVRCPQCGGRGAPPAFVEGEPRARICATCGTSATPDLPLVGESEALREYVERHGAPE